MLETKGGAIQKMIAFDMTKVHDTALDLIVGDAEGNVFLFSNQELLARRNVALPISALAPDIDAGMKG